MDESSTTTKQPTASLRRFILVRVAPPAILLLILLAVVAERRVTSAVRKEIQKRVNENAIAKAQQTTARLKLLIDACRATAQNDVIVNGVVDLEHRNSVTESFFNSLRLPGTKDQMVVMTDYRGRRVAGHAGMRDLRGAKWLPKVLEGNDVITIEDQQLLIAVPVRYAGRPEAAIVASLSLEEFLKDDASAKASDLIAFEYRGDVLTSSDHRWIDPGEPLVPPPGWLTARSSIDLLPETRVVMLESEMVALRAADTVSMAMFVVGIIVTVTAILTFLLISRLVTAPLNAMLRQIERVQMEGDLNARVPRADISEFDEVGRRFNAMLSRLQDTTVSAERFREARTQLELALEGGNVGLWDWNTLTDETYFSPILKSQLGYEPDANWDSLADWQQRLHPEDAEAAVATVMDYFEGRREDYEQTFRLRCANGSYRWILSKGIADFDEQHKPLRMIGVHVDINDRVEHERILEQSNHELEQFAYVASHDLQEPLRKVSSFCSLLEEEESDRLSEDGKQYLHYIVDGSRRMKTLIKDLLTYSRVKTQAQPLQETDAEEALLQAIENLDHAIQDSGAEVTHDPLPVVWAAPRPLTQVFQNLIGNALKYCEEPTPKVHISIREQDEGYVIGVKDNGIGIDPQFHERVFGIFKRLHSREQYSGTGIGLAICKRVVERWGGEMCIDSTAGSGSTLLFSVPKSLQGATSDQPDTAHPVHG